MYVVVQRKPAKKIKIFWYYCYQNIARNINKHDTKFINNPFIYHTNVGFPVDLRSVKRTTHAN